MFKRDNAIRNKDDHVMKWVLGMPLSNASIRKGAKVE